MARPPEELSSEIIAQYRAADANIRSLTMDIARNPGIYRSGGMMAQAEQTLLQMISDMDAATHSWYEIALPDLYRRGAQVAQPGRYRLTEDDQKIIGGLQDDGVRDSIVANELAKRDVARMIDDLTTGRSDPKLLTALAQREGIRGMRYQDGRRFQVGTYNSMAINARAHSTFNIGTVNTAIKKGILALEIVDGPECGLTAHNDPDRADGKIVHAEDALAYPIAHPYCQRHFVPRPDLDAPIPLHLSLRLPKKLGTIPGLGGPILAAAGGVALGGGVALALADANLRRQLISVAERSKPWFKIFAGRLGTIVEEMQRRGLAEVFDITTGLRIPATITAIREDVATYADSVIEGLEDLPDHVGYVLGLTAESSKKVVGDAFGQFMDFVEHERDVAGDLFGKILPFDRKVEIQDLFRKSARRWSPNQFVTVTLPRVGQPAFRVKNYLLDWMGIPFKGSGFGPIQLRRGGFLYDRAARIILTPNKFIRLTGTARVNWEKLFAGALSPKDLIKFIPRLRLNPNGLVRAGFSFVEGRILPSLSLVGKGPLRLITRLNPGGSLSTTVRFVTKGWFNFSASVNTELDVISKAMKDFGLFDLKDFTSLEGVRNQFDLARAAVKQQISEIAWDDFNIRSLAAELRIHGFSIFDIAHTFRMKWEDALTLMQKAKEFLGETLNNATLWYQQRRWGALVTELPGAKVRMDLYTKITDSQFHDVSRLKVEPSVVEGSKRVLSQTRFVEDVNRIAQMMEERFPLAGRLRFDLRESSDVPYSELMRFMGKDEVLPNTLGLVHLDENTIFVRQETFGHWEQEVQSIYADSRASGHFNKFVNDKISLIVHEAGHLLESQLTPDQKVELMLRLRENVTLWKAAKPFKNPEQVLAALRTLGLDESAVAEGVDRMFEEEIGRNLAVIGKNVSIYGMKNQYEFMAEAFSNYMTSPRFNSVSDTVGKFFEEIFGTSGVGPGVVPKAPEFGIRRAMQVAGDPFFNRESSDLDAIRMLGLRDRVSKFFLLDIPLSQGAVVDSSDWVAFTQNVSSWWNDPHNNPIWTPNIFKNLSEDLWGPIQKRLKDVSSIVDIENTVRTFINPQWVNADWSKMFSSIGSNHTAFQGQLEYFKATVDHYFNLAADRFPGDTKRIAEEFARIFPSDLLIHAQQWGDFLVFSEDPSVVMKKMIVMAQAWNESGLGQTLLEDGGRILMDVDVMTHDNLLDDLFDLSNTAMHKAMYEALDNFGTVTPQEWLDFPWDKIAESYYNMTTSVVNHFHGWNISDFVGAQGWIAEKSGGIGTVQSSMALNDLDRALSLRWQDWLRGLTEPERDLFYSYNSAAYRVVNNFLRKEAGAPYAVNYLASSHDLINRLHSLPEPYLQMIMDDAVQDIPGLADLWLPRANSYDARRQFDEWLASTTYAGDRWHVVGGLLWQALEGTMISAERLESVLRRGITEYSEALSAVLRRSVSEVPALEESITVFRGTNVDSLPREIQDDLATHADLLMDAYGTVDHPSRFAPIELMEGMEYADHGFVSTSISQSFSIEWMESHMGQSVLYKITVPPGVAGIYIPPLVGSHEFEYLLDRGYTLRVTGVDLSGPWPLISLIVQEPQ